MRYFRLNIFFSIFFALWINQILQPNTLQEESYYKPENILLFAESLYQEGEYLRAVSEFQRYLYFFDDLPPNADYIFYKIGFCFRMCKNFQKAIDYFQKVIDDYPKSNYRDDCYYQIALCYFFMGNHQESISFVDSNFQNITSNPKSLKMFNLKGLNLIYQKKWDEAIEHFSSFRENQRIDYFTSSLLNFAKEGKQLPRKNKFMAGLLSTVIPGTGKIYCGRTADGLVSLLTIGLTGWQAYEAFRKEGRNSTRGWVYGTLSIFLYLGNIYGSTVAVKIYNEQLEDNFFKRISATVNVYF